jgi:flagellar hook assembly protein FlgD
MPLDSATVSFTVPGDSASPVKIGLYDSGRSLVRVLVDSVYAPGNHRINWRPRDKTGAPLSSGYYYYQLEICGNLSTLKISYRREKE